MGKDNTINTTFFSHTGADDLFAVDICRTYSFKPTGGGAKVLTQSMADAIPVAAGVGGAPTAAEVNTHGVTWPQDQAYSNSPSAEESQVHEKCYVRVPTGTTLIGDRQVR